MLFIDIDNFALLNTQSERFWNGTSWKKESTWWKIWKTKVSTSRKSDEFVQFALNFRQLAIYGLISLNIYIGRQTLLYSRTFMKMMCFGYGHKWINKDNSETEWFIRILLSFVCILSWRSFYGITFGKYLTVNQCWNVR